ncbi:hypothetical protein KXD40_004531 [Peronospora effusa]|nr:hypothetical protein KXD40_004531 [Peronospora effusa]
MSASTPPRRFGMNTWPVLRVARSARMSSDQLARQIKSQRMLLFKRAALTEKRKADCKLFQEHCEDPR